MKGISFALAITASIASADKSKFSVLKNLQNEMVDSLYEDSHDAFDHYHEPLEHNPYMDEYAVGFDHHSAIDHRAHGLAEHTAYYDVHGHDPDSHYDVEHNPYEYDNFPVVVQPLYEDEHEPAFAYETYREYPHDLEVPFIPAEPVYHETDPLYHEAVMPVFEDHPYETHEYEEHLPVYTEIPVYDPNPYAFEHDFEHETVVPYHGYEEAHLDVHEPHHVDHHSIIEPLHDTLHDLHGDWHVEAPHLDIAAQPKKA